MFEFQWPWLAVLLPLPLLVWRLWPRPVSAGEQQQSDQAVLLHPAIARLRHAYGAASPRLPVGLFAHAALLVIAWAGLVIALMGPQKVESFDEVTSRGYDLVVAVDTSRSMGALDFTLDGRPVSRMAVIKGVLGNFIRGRQGDRVGLIVFGDEAVVQAPLTLDVGMVSGMLDAAEPGMVGNSTAIGDAIGVAVKKLRERPEQSRILVLVTDGENTAGSLPPTEAVRLAVHYNVRIYTVGVGTKGLVPFSEGGRMRYERMPIDEDLLREVAGATGGAYFRATDTRALEAIYQRIDALEKTEAESRSVMIPKPLYRWPLGVALLALLALALLSIRRQA